MPDATTLQELPPRLAHFCLGIRRYIRDDLEVDIQGSRLLVGLSGGADSTALLRILCFLAPGLNLHLEAAHLDHGLREESTEDADSCRELCERLHVRLHSIRKDVGSMAKAQGQGIEETARNCRYSFYSACMQAVDADWLMLAHHADDLAEDVVMRLIRGSGWPELAGMPGIDVKRRLLRPLLGTPKAKLLDFLRALGQTWREDSSNTDMGYFRNRVRHTLMPLIVRENPAFATGLETLRHIASADAAHFGKGMNEIVPDQPNENGEIVLSALKLSQCDTAIRLRSFKLAIERMGRGQALADNIFQLEKTFCAARHGKVIQFPGGVNARVERNFVRFFAISDKWTMV